MKNPYFRQYFFLALAVVGTIIATVCLVQDNILAGAGVMLTAVYCADFSYVSPSEAMAYLSAKYEPPSQKSPSRKFPKKPPSQKPPDIPFSQWN